MSRKTLRMNKFGESILDEIELFTYHVKDIHRKYPDNPDNNMDVYTLFFNWAWNGYEGFGKIDFYQSSFTLCNVFGENESQLSISSSSKKQQPNGRSTCSLYNDQTLVPLLNMILSKSNLTPTREYPY